MAKLRMEPVYQREPTDGGQRLRRVLSRKWVSISVQLPCLCHHFRKQNPSVDLGSSTRGSGKRCLSGFLPFVTPEPSFLRHRHRRNVPYPGWWN